jgi:hypothetical protein
VSKRDLPFVARNIRKLSRKSYAKGGWWQHAKPWQIAPHDHPTESIDP